ncbi:MAG: hypothetical protein WB557_06065 [Solirubrobacteraceae bacterium]
MFTISTRLAIPVHSGSRWLASIGAADELPWSRNTIPRTNSSAPGISVPITRPFDASFATPLTPPRDETHTPAQNTTTITTPVYTPLLARSGLITYASVLATNPSSVG